jgi:chemotaxis protein histidine kinase CheA
MSIRLDPRRLSALKLLAAEAGVRPGELVTHWVEERLDAARAGGPAASAAPGGTAIAELRTRLESLERRIDALAAAPSTTSQEPTVEGEAAAATSAAPAAAESQPEAPARKRGRPPKKAAARSAQTSRSPGPRIGLHEEIAAIIAERGPLTAAEIAAAVVERGRYAPPRSSRPIDASIVNSRVSNPVYRARFTRSDGRIGLAAGE